MNEVDLFQKHLQFERNLSPHTVSSYVSDVSQFITAVPTPLPEITAGHITEYICNLRNKGMKVTATNRKLSALKTFFRFLLKQGIVSANPTNLVDGGKQERRLPKPVELETIDKVANASDSTRNKTIVEVLYGTGIRRSELVKIKVADIIFSRGVLRVLGKGGKERVVPLHPTALALVKQQADSHTSPFLFPGRTAGSHLSTRQLNDIIKKLARRAGASGVTPHKFRHSFCSHLFERGADLKVIQDLAGHSSPVTTQVYTQLSNTRNIHEYLQCHPRAR